MSETVRSGFLGCRRGEVGVQLARLLGWSQLGSPFLGGWHWHVNHDLMFQCWQRKYVTMNGHFGTLLTSGIENLVAEFNPPTSTMGQNEEDKLHLQAGFQKKKGLRDGIDAADQLWMSIGSTQVAMPRGSSSHNIRQKDINALSQLGGDVEVLRQPGPKRDQVRRLCEVLAEGVGPKKYSAQDGELLILLLGHFAWFSHSHAREIIEFGGHTAIVDWLRTDRFKGQSNPLDDTLAFPLHRACLSALASICRHGIDTSNHLLELDGVELALEFATHLEAGVRCAALRLLARLIPYAAKRHPQKDSLPLHIMWPILLAELQSGDELLRTVAAACSLEAIATACVPVDGNVSQNLALALLHALELATASDSSATALPLLIAVNRMAADEDEGICTAMRNNENLIPLLTLPCTMPIFQDPTVASLCGPIWVQRDSDTLDLHLLYILHC